MQAPIFNWALVKRDFPTAVALAPDIASFPRARELEDHLAALPADTFQSLYGVRKDVIRLRHLAIRELETLINREFFAPVWDPEAVASIPGPFDRVPEAVSSYKVNPASVPRPLAQTASPGFTPHSGWFFQGGGVSPALHFLSPGESGFFPPSAAPGTETVQAVTPVDQASPTSGGPTP